VRWRIVVARWRNNGVARSCESVASSWRESGGSGSGGISLAKKGDIEKERKHRRKQHGIRK